jgi:hypothetical protein
MPPILSNLQEHFINMEEKRSRKLPEINPTVINSSGFPMDVGRTAMELLPLLSLQLLTVRVLLNPQYSLFSLSHSAGEKPAQNNKIIYPQNN